MYLLRIRNKLWFKDAAIKRFYLFLQIERLYIFRNFQLCYAPYYAKFSDKLFCGGGCVYFSNSFI